MSILRNFARNTAIQFFVYLLKTESEEKRNNIAAVYILHAHFIFFSLLVEGKNVKNAIYFVWKWGQFGLTYGNWRSSFIFPYEMELKKQNIFVPQPNNSRFPWPCFFHKKNFSIFRFISNETIKRWTKKDIAYSMKLVVLCIFILYMSTNHGNSINGEQGKK